MTDSNLPLTKEQAREKIYALFNVPESGPRREACDAISTLGTLLKYFFNERGCTYSQVEAFADFGASGLKGIIDQHPTPQRMLKAAQALASVPTKAEIEQQMREQVYGAYKTPLAQSDIDNYNERPVQILLKRFYNDSAAGCPRPIVAREMGIEAPELGSRLNGVKLDAKFVTVFINAIQAVVGRATSADLQAWAKNTERYGGI